MMVRFAQSCLAAVLALGLSGAMTPAAEARSGEPIVSEMRALLVTTDQNGYESLTPTDEAAPGDTIEYQITYQNISGSAVDGLVINGPMPSSTEYVANSAVGAGADALEVSIDNGVTWESEPVTRMQKNEYGQLVEVVIPATEYTHVRWVAQSALQPQNVATYRYRVTVE